MKGDDSFSAWWRNRPLPVDDHPDPSRVDLYDRFFANPRGRHDLEVQTLVSGVRGSGRIPRFVLARVDRDHWQVLKLPLLRGAAPEIIGDRLFADRDEAERYVMRRRLSLLGEIDEAATDRSAG